LKTLALHGVGEAKVTGSTKRVRVKVK